MIDKSATKSLFGFRRPSITVRDYQCTISSWVKLTTHVTINKSKTLRCPRHR